MNNEELRKVRIWKRARNCKGWVNIANPFRGTWVVGTPGSGKTFSIIEPFIRQHSAKGFALVVYDYKFPLWRLNCIIITRRTKSWENCPKDANSNIIDFVNILIH